MKEEKREELEKEKITGVGKDINNNVNEESKDKTLDVQDSNADMGGSEEQVKNGIQEIEEQSQAKEDIQDEEDIQDKEEIQGKKEIQDKEKIQGKNESQDKEEIQDKEESQDKRESQDKEEIQDKEDIQDKEKTQGKVENQDLDETQAKEETQDKNQTQNDQETQEEENKQIDHDHQENNEAKEEAKEEIKEEGNKESEHKDQEKEQETVQQTEQHIAQPVNDSQTEDISDTIPTKKKGRIWKKILIGFGCFVLLCVLGVYIGGAVYFRDKFFINTKVNGMDVSKQTVEMVDNTIANNIHKYTITLTERGKKKEKITADQIGYHYVSDGEVQGFKDHQNPYTWPRALWENYRYKFESSTTYDKKKLTKTLKALDCMNEKNVVAPKDAFLKFGETTYEIEPEVEGNTVDYEKLAALVKNLIEHGEKKASLEKNDCYVQPAVRQDNEPLNQLMNNLNQYCRTSITYVFGEKREVLDGKTIKDWVTYDEAGTVTFDEEQVHNYVNMLADQYDTYDRPREFKTNDGSMVTVKGGSYGWMVDQEQEIVDLTKLIQLGAEQERSPAFAQTAVSFDNSDLGQDYIEIDLTRQHLWMYIGGQVAVSSDFVSGSMVKAGCATPGGTYTLYYKKSPDVLRSDKPGDSYATPVTYWMPFNGGIGLHDANWRGSFGGNIYQYNGSHGCINLPTDAARQIYEQIYKGFPIICYYR